MGRSWLSGVGQPKKRDCFAGSPLCVIARNVAISPFRSRQTEKREIASQARNDKDSCHREGRSDLACPNLANPKERLLRRLATPRGGLDKIAEITSQARKETTVASAALEMTQMKASAGLSGRRARVCDLFPSLSAFSALNPKLLYTINYIKELPQAGKVG